MIMEKINAATDSALRKPRLALMGEFSAGKSTLANLLTGGQHLPVQVTATQLPPVWISYGTSPAYRIDLEGKTIPVSLARLDDVPIAETAYIRFFEQSDMLASCDIIDMPGISDPNMPAEIWQRVLPQADGVIWCTHATQAWRQSENAIWATMPPELQAHSLLLLTRIDKIISERDRDRIVKRVNKETAGLFAAPCLPISLTGAIAAQGRADLLTASGADEFLCQLIGLIQSIQHSLGHPLSSTTPDTVQSDPILPRRIKSEPGNATPTPRPAFVQDDPEVAAFRAILRGKNR